MLEFFRLAFAPAMGKGLKMHTQRVKLLLVEPDEYVADITAFRLELFGYQVAWARSLDDAREHLEVKDPPAMIVLGTAVTAQTSSERIETLCSQFPDRKIPVAALSLSANSVAFVSPQAGMVEIVATPYDPPVLEQTLRSLMDRSRRAMDNGRTRISSEPTTVAAVAP